uniref:Uncharacterized protein n=1 Tax=viral metagenome TaxID=1070528 RepID=A0A6C0EFT9_9ZZZZ
MVHYIITYTKVGELDFCDIFRQPLGIVISADNYDEAVDKLLRIINNGELFINKYWEGKINAKEEIVNNLFKLVEGSKYIIPYEANCFRVTPEYYVAFEEYKKKTKIITRELFDKFNVNKIKTKNNIDKIIPVYEFFESKIIS